jgi:hypothetical protein
VFLKNLEMTTEQHEAHTYYFGTDPASLKRAREGGIKDVKISPSRVNYDSEVQCRKISMSQVMQRYKDGLDPMKLLPGKAYFNDVPNSKEQAFVRELAVNKGLDPSTMSYAAMLGKVTEDLKEHFANDTLPKDIKEGLIAGNHSTRAMLMNIEEAEERQPGSSASIPEELRFR